MPERNFPPPPAATIADDELLEGDEVVVIVDDFPDIVGLLREFLEQRGFPAVAAGSAGELRQHLATGNVALVMLDIGLPDADGMQLLPELKQSRPDLAVIMLTAVTDLQTALVCLRYGADDYLTKPVHFADLLTTPRKVLEKRRLTIRNRQYQRQIEQANFRIQLAHQLAMKMNTAYLSMVELDEILNAILIGITAEEGLQFNRASPCSMRRVRPWRAGWPSVRATARRAGASGRTWSVGVCASMTCSPRWRAGGPDRFRGQPHCPCPAVDAAATDHLLIRAVRERRSINVVNGHCDSPCPWNCSVCSRRTAVVVPCIHPAGRSA